MANASRGQVIRAVAVRGLRLDSAGVILPGASSAYVHQSPIMVEFTPQVPDRDRFEQVDGNGNTCALFIGPPRPSESVNLTMNLCALDAELLEFLAGGSVISDPVSPYDTIGYLAPTASTVNVNGVSFETWSIAWNGRQRKLLGGDAAYYRHAFPLTKWQQGATRMENGISVIPLTGIGEVNSSWDDGLASDPFPEDIGDSAWGWALVTDVPADSAGYAAVP